MSFSNKVEMGFQQASRRVRTRVCWKPLLHPDKTLMNATLRSCFVSDFFPEPLSPLTYTQTQSHAHELHARRPTRFAGCLSSVHSRKRWRWKFERTGLDWHQRTSFIQTCCWDAKSIRSCLGHPGFLRQGWCGALSICLFSRAEGASSHEVTPAWVQGYGSILKPTLKITDSQETL